VNPRAAAFGIDEPDGRDAELEIIVDLALDARGAVLGREDLDGNVRRGDDASLRAPTSDNDNIRDAKTIRTDLNSDLDTSPKAAPVS
jgi:hypothetical protein